MLCDCATLVGSEMLLLPWLLWMVLPAVLLSAESVLACPKDGFRDGEGSRGEATSGLGHLVR